MSALAYYKGRLYGDVIGYSQDDRLDTYCQMKKIFPSKHGDAFLGLVGRELLDNHQEIIDLSILTIYGKATDDQRMELHSLTFGRSIILMTKEHAYSFDSMAREFNLLNPDRVNCWGNGQTHVMISVRLGLSVVEAIGVYHRVAYGIPRTKTPEYLAASHGECAPIDLNNYLSKEEISE